MNIQTENKVHDAHRPVSATAKQLAACGVLILGFAITGCATTSVENLGPSQPTSATTVPESNGEIQGVCEALSVLDTSTMYALVDLQSGVISEAQAAAIINTIPDSIRTIGTFEPTPLANDLTSLAAAIESTPPAIPGSLFNPDGEPYRGVFQSVRDKCFESGVEIRVAGR